MEAILLFTCISIQIHTCPQQQSRYSLVLLLTVLSLIWGWVERMEKWSLPIKHLFYFLMKERCSLWVLSPFYTRFLHFPVYFWGTSSWKDPFLSDLCVYFYDIVRLWSFRTSQKAQLFVESGEEGLQIWTVKNLISNFGKDASVLLFPTSVFGLNVEQEEKGCITHGLGDLSGYLWPSVGSVHGKHLMTLQPRTFIQGINLVVTLLWSLLVSWQ